MNKTPPFLDTDRPDVPDLVVPRGVVPFHLADAPVRGRLIRLGPLGAALLSRHDHPPATNRLAGEALALAAGLAGALKFRGSFSLQAKGDGPVRTLVADCTEQGALRCYAALSPSPSDASPLAPDASARRLLGNGYLAFTVDQGAERDRHQGIVAIEGETLAEMAEHYFATSEQHACRILLACAETARGWRAAALILERIAQSDDETVSQSPGAEDAWQTAALLAATVTASELLDDDLAPETLLHRLFHGAGLRLGQPRALAFGCRCSRARLAAILDKFSPDDLDAMVVAAEIVMTCEFCNVDFRFPRASLGGKAGEALAGRSGGG